MSAGGIGIIGLGNIARTHLKAYERFGMPVVAGCDISATARAAFAESHPAMRIYASIEELLADPAVAYIDLATPHHRAARLPLIERIADARKPVFIQKPLAMTYDDALAMVEALERAQTPGMVNQNMCFTPGGRTLPPVLLDECAIGDPFLAHLDLRMCFDCHPDEWFGKDERWWTIGLTIHHLGLLQMLFGPPERVYAMMGRDPAQPGVTYEGYGHLALHYPSGMHLTLVSTGTYYGVNPIPHTHEQLWIQGPLGVIDWQPQRGFTVTLRTEKAHPAEARRHVTTPGSWFPDAFALGMAHFQQAVAAGAQPLCSVQDNLYVMALIEAAYRSTASGAPVDLATIMGERYIHTYGPGWHHGYTLWAAPTPLERSAE